VKTANGLMPLDANGLPVGHVDALHAASKELAEAINELPESLYHFNPIDAEWATQRVIARYLGTVRKQQRARVCPNCKAVVAVQTAMRGQVQQLIGQDGTTHVCPAARANLTAVSS
jgi:hypothetical protein